MKTMEFDSKKKLKEWTDQVSISELNRTPTLINNGKEIRMECVMTCEKWKTALRRFQKQYADISETIDSWIKVIIASCEDGCFFQDVHGSCGRYSFDVTRLSKNTWYILFCASGRYAHATERRK